MGIVNLIKPLFNNKPTILFIHIPRVGVKRLELEKKMNHPSMNLSRYDLMLHARLGYHNYMSFVNSAEKGSIGLKST